MYRLSLRFALLAALLAGTAVAQGFATVNATLPVLPYNSDAASATYVPTVIAPPVTLPRMAPELALRAYQQKSALQAAALTEYSSVTLIRATLPESSQSGEFQLQRHYSAPRSLQFKAIRFIGDGFVKTNIIARLLQSEVDHVEKDDLSLTALTPANYKFSAKGTTEINGRSVHVYQVKPRKKRIGLFKGHIYLDAYTGSLVRAEGSSVKSPSFLIRKIDFVQDYVDVGAFTFPTHLHSEATAHLVGLTIVDIYQGDFEPVSSSPVAAQQLPSL